MVRTASSLVRLARLAFGLSVLTMPLTMYAQDLSDVVLTMPINIDGSPLDLHLRRGQSYEDAAMAFVQSHQLGLEDQSRIRSVVGQLTGMLQEQVQAKGGLQALSAALGSAPQKVVQLTIPFSMNGVGYEMSKLEDENIPMAVERFLRSTGLDQRTMQELYPQLVELMQQKLNEIQPPRKELFALPFTLDGRQVVARHFEDGDPTQEAEQTLRSIGIQDTAFLQRMITQVAAAISERIADMTAASSAAAVPEPATPTARELFSLPLTFNGQPRILVHYEGQTSRESALRFLADNGITDPNEIQRLQNQLVEMVDKNIADMLRKEVEAQAAEQARAAEAAAAAIKPREPILQLPINVGNDQQVTLDYFEGDSIERTVESFLSRLGMQDGPTFQENAQQLAAMVREQLNARAPTHPTSEPPAETAPQQQAQEQDQALPEQQHQESHAEESAPTRSSPLLSIPIAISGYKFTLDYYSGQAPNYAATSFCVEKHEILRNERGIPFDNENLIACRDALVNAIQTMSAKTEAAPLAETATTTPEANEVSESVPESTQMEAHEPHELFRLDVTMDGQTIPLIFNENDDPKQVVSAFCTKYDIPVSNAPSLIEALEKQVAQLKQT